MKISTNETSITHYVVIATDPFIPAERFETGEPDLAEKVEAALTFSHRLVNVLIEEQLIGGNIKEVL